MLRHFHLFVILAFVLVPSCQPDPTREAIERQLQMYPESRGQDIYKSFCQDNLGPGHLIPNPDAAKAYLLEELQTYREDLENGRYDKPALRYVSVGDAGNYIQPRSDVPEIPRTAFVRSANEGKTLSAEEWKEKWAEVASVIRKDFPALPDAEKDLAAIDSLMAEGHFILHHSRIFNETYHPHYRIVARDIFENELKPLL